MASILIQHTVKDYAVWKKAFDSHAGLRTSGGELSVKIYRDSSNPNNLTVINQWKSLESAQKFAGSPELKAAMEESGVTGTPQVYFLNEA
jgi:quinol monooxygenase YgiN